MMGFHTISIVPGSGGGGESISVTTSSAQSAVIHATQPCYVVMFSTVSCFMRQAVNPTAVANTDQYIPANIYMRIGPFAPGNKMALIGTGSGTAYLYREN